MYSQDDLGSVVSHFLSLAAAFHCTKTLSSSPFLLLTIKRRNREGNEEILRRKQQISLTSALMLLTSGGPKRSKRCFFRFSWSTCVQIQEYQLQIKPQLCIHPFPQDSSLLTLEMIGETLVPNRSARFFSLSKSAGYGARERHGQHIHECKPTTKKANNAMCNHDNRYTSTSWICKRRLQVWSRKNNFIPTAKSYQQSSVYIKAVVRMHLESTSSPNKPGNTRRCTLVDHPFSTTS